MTDIEQKALALVNEVAADDAPWTLDDVKGGVVWKALCRAIEAQAREITRLREALVGIRAVIEDMDGPFDASASGEMHYGFEIAIEHATNRINERLGETSND